MSYVVIFFSFVALDKLIVLIAYSLNKSSRICLKVGCHNCHIQNETQKTTIPPFDSFREKKLNPLFIWLKLGIFLIG